MVATPIYTSVLLNPNPIAVTYGASNSVYLSRYEVAVNLRSNFGAVPVGHKYAAPPTRLANSVVRLGC